MKTLTANNKHCAGASKLSFVDGDYRTAASVLEKRIRREPETDISRALLAACYGHLGLYEDALRQWEEIRKINPNYSVQKKAQILTYKDPADWDRFLEGLRTSGIPI